MSSMASNYDMSRLYTGQAVALAAGLLATAVVFQSRPRLESLKSLVFLLVTTVLYGIMMFASSYVEEEQHFWYWASSAWVVCLTLIRMKRYVFPFRSEA
jgi:ethanolaminephosphotransferase